MAHHERDSPMEGQGNLRHQHSGSSDLNVRALVPMWDSSDPDRAPPPLPLNPVSPSSFQSRAGTSSAIQSAHAALSERARESSGASVPPLLVKRLNESPERGLMKNNHRRMQSLQPGSVRDLSLMIESGNSPNASPTRSPEKREFNLADRANTPTPIRRKDLEREDETISIDKDSMTGPMPGPSLTPILRPTALRRPHAQSILGENTPPQSSTMLALQNMGSRDNIPRDAPEPPLSNITNGSMPKLQSQYQGLDQLSAQILTLTNIATTLQKEMSALSRRSRDNATDLLSLKEATNTRDEDIRKSLRDLLNNAGDAAMKLGAGQYSSLYLDNKPHGTPKLDHARPYQLARVPSPKSFSESIDRASASTPSLSGVENSISTTLLEKIIKEMGTKEGQESLVSRLVEISQRLSETASAGKVDEILDHVRTQSHGALVPTTNRARNYSDVDTEVGPLSQRVEALLQSAEGRASTSRGADILNDDLIKIIRSVKDGVAQGGGLTAEVKALVRDLRGEVLGMGRELGKRLEQIGRRGIEDSEPASKDEVSRIIDEGLEQMKDQLNNVLREHRRQSAQSVAASKALVDYQEIYNAMRAALRDNEAAHEVPDLSRDDVIDAVREAWENYKPEIEVQQLGLERDALLACLREGIQEYAPGEGRSSSASPDDVFKAVMEGLKHFVPPQMTTPVSMTRDEIIEAVRDCLEEFEFPVAAAIPGNEAVTRADMVHAVREGLNVLDLPRNDALVPHSGSDTIIQRLEDMRQQIIRTFKEGFSEIDVTQSHAVGSRGGNNEIASRIDELKTDMVHAVKTAVGGLDLSQVGGAQADNEELLSRLEDFMEHVKSEMQTVSQEVKTNISTKGGDTEQILETTKQGLENLRTAIETYVDRATVSGGQGEGSGDVLKSLEGFKEDISKLMIKQSETAREQLQSELEGLRDIVNSSMVPATHVANGRNEEVMDALHSAVNSLRTEILRPRSETTNILDALNDGLGEIRVGIDRMSNKPADLTANDEILEALKTGLDSVRSDIETIREGNSMVMAAVPKATTEDPGTALVSADIVKQDDIRKLEGLVSQIYSQMQNTGPTADGSGLLKEDLGRLEGILSTVREGVEKIESRDTVAAVPSVQKGDVDRLESLISTVQEKVDTLVARPEIPRPPTTITSTVGTDTVTITGDLASKDDVQAIETILRNTKSRLDDLMDGDQAIRKEHLDAVESLIAGTKETVGTIADAMDPEIRKAELATIETGVSELKSKLEEVQQKVAEEAENPEKVTKAQVEAVEGVVLEIKNVVDALQGVDFSTMPNKDDVASIQAIVQEAKEKIESFGETTTTALAKRDEELAEKEDAIVKGNEQMVVVGDRVTEVKAFLEQFQETVKSKLEEGSAGLEKMEGLLNTMGETVAAVIDAKTSPIGTDLKEMFETMKTEFEDSKSIVAGAKIDSDQKLSELTANINNKFDEKINELISKYDAFQTAQDEKSQATESRDSSTEAAVVGTKAVADELKTLIDTLRTSVTESMEKMEEASQTVFGKVEELVTKSEENHTEARTEHQQTRDDLQQALTVVEALASEVNGNNPKILEAIQEVMTLVGKQYEHAQESVTLIQEKIIEAKPEIPTPEKYDDTEIHGKLDALAALKYDDTEIHGKLDALAEMKYDDTEIQGKLDALAELKYDDTEIHGKLDALGEMKYDDGAVQEKLDKLVTHSDQAKEVFSQLETLDKVHQSVVKTAADISEFLSIQTQRVAYENEDRERKLQETKVALACKREEKDHLDASVMSLKDEEDRLRKSVAALKTEQESLIRQKTRLTSDVSSLETALRLRKEELGEMESRAERLERRILEGVMDHSRVLLMGKATKAGGESMNRKRVRKSINDDANPVAKVMNIVQSGKRTVSSAPGTAGTGRRIASLGQINNGNSASSGVKRSQSTRASKAYRKRSWGGDTGFSELDKENISVRETVEEVDETEGMGDDEAGQAAVGEEAGGDDEEKSTAEENKVQGDEVVVYEHY